MIVYSQERSGDLEPRCLRLRTMSLDPKDAAAFEGCLTDVSGFESYFWIRTMFLDSNDVSGFERCFDIRKMFLDSKDASAFMSLNQPVAARYLSRASKWNVCEGADLPFLVFIQSLFDCNQF